MFIEFIILCTLLYFFLRFWLKSSNDFFEKRGIPYEKKNSYFGGLLDLMLQRKTAFDFFNELYKKLDGPVIGVFDMWTPVFVLRDLDIIKNVTVKDFDHFINHRSHFTDTPDGELFGISVFSMQDAKWRAMRSVLTPAFTGSKMRQMFELLNKAAQGFMLQLKKEASVAGKTGYELDMKDYSTRLTSDVVATTAFGLEVNSLQNPDNEFYRMGRQVTNFTPWKNIKMLLFMHMRPVMKFFKLEMQEKHLTQYFMRLVLDTMQYRKQHGIQRPDIINALMEAHGMIPAEGAKKSDIAWTEKEIVAQCFGFFFAGFDTSSVLICITMHELMENADIQHKLYEEVKLVDAQLQDGALVYESLQKLHYMDMVLSETLRKWPPNLFSDRECNKDIAYEVNGQRIEFKKGDQLWIPTVGLQRDPQYFENPDKFDPERFSDENKHKILPSAYMPFGAGPRICIGNRFVLMQTKAFLFYLLRDFCIEPAKNSTIPLELSAKTFQLAPKTGYWFKLVPRD